MPADTPAKGSNTEGVIEPEDSNVPPPTSPVRQGLAPIEIDAEENIEVDDGLEQREETASDDGSGPEPAGLIEEVYENGRRYCNETYPMPNDEQEQTRHSIIHQAYLLILNNRLTKAPIPPNARILDIGTGGGDWAISTAESYPDATIIATDISYFDMPTELPRNLELEIDNAEDQWTYNEPFDFIHIRGMSGAISDWPRLYSQCLAHLRPGGYIEVIDWIFSSISGLTSEDYLNIYGAAIVSGHEAAGLPRNFDHFDPHVLADAGLEVPELTRLRCPLSPWPDEATQKTIGKMALVVFLEGMEANCLRVLTKFQGWSLEDVRDLCAKVSAEIQAPGSKPELMVNIMLARRPEEMEGSEAE
ncbi:MAG: hypothetical protein Q9227_009464 [Pyrenula ochraceoflavens]